MTLARTFVAASAVLFLGSMAFAAETAPADVKFADNAVAASLSGAPRPGAPQGPQEAGRSAPKGGGSIRPAGAST